MEKIRKLRLKRKLPQQKSRVVSEHCKEQNVNEAETVLLSSDSEECDGGLQSKQRKQSEPCPPPEEMGFLQTNNPSLNRLRQMILSLSPREKDIANLSPFPAFPTQDEDKQGDRAKLLQERLQPVDKLQRLEDLPPFPKLCRHFTRRAQAADIDHSDTKSAEIHVAKKNDVSHKQMLDLNTTSYDSNESSTSTENKQTQHKQCIANSTIDSSKLKLRKIQTSDISELGDENSAVIRDRNSNFYALQSQNRPVRSVIKKSESSVLNTGVSKERIVQKKSVDKCTISDSFVNQQNSKLYKKVATDIPTSSSYEEEKKVQVGGILQSCPLCQMEFDSRFGQMEIDSHIATCLSTSEDDIVW